MMTTDYKSLFERAMTHLDAVCSSRNAFTPEARELLFQLPDDIHVRSHSIEGLHCEAVKFLDEHRQDIS